MHFFLLGKEGKTLQDNKFEGKCFPKMKNTCLANISPGLPMAVGIGVAAILQRAVGTLSRFDLEGLLFLSYERRAVSKVPETVPPYKAAIPRKRGYPKPLQKKPILHLKA